MGNDPWLISVEGDGLGAMIEGIVEGTEEEMEGVTEGVLSMLGIGDDDIFHAIYTDRVTTETSRRAWPRL